MARVDDPYHLLDRAVEYYVTGRFAALNNLQVAPNPFTVRSKCLRSSSCSEAFETITSRWKWRSTKGALWP
jgi:hypothetical protein